MQCGTKQTVIALVLVETGIWRMRKRLGLHKKLHTTELKKKVIKYEQMIFLKETNKKKKERKETSF